MLLKLAIVLGTVLVLCDARAISCGSAPDGTSCFAEEQTRGFSGKRFSPSNVGAASASGAPRSNNRYVRLAPETTGWVDLPQSRFHRFHDYLLYVVQATIPLYRVEPRTMSWGCTNEIYDFYSGKIFKIGSCTALVFVYRCKPCDSPGQEGLVTKLLAADWTQVKCAAYFQLDHTKNSHDHRFAMYYKEFDSSPDSRSKLSLVVEEPTELMFWGSIHRESSMCSHKDDEVQCNNHSMDDCYWDDSSSECKPKMCPPTKHSWQGAAVPECQKCVYDDEKDLLFQ